MALSFASARLIMGLFFFYSFSISSWLIRIPDIQQSLKLEPAMLSVCLIGIPVGLVISMAFSGVVVERFGPRNAFRYGFWFLAAALLLPGLASHALWLFFALVLLGLTMGPVEVGVNVAADRIGVALGRTIMSRCHGFWSLGLMAGGALGSLAAAYGLEPHIHMALVALFVLVSSQILAARLPDALSDNGAEATAEKAPVFVLPPRNIVLLCLFGFGMLMVEGAITDWSAIYLRDVFGAVPPVTGFAFTTFGLVMAAGRLGGDYLSMRFGPVTMARVCCAFGLAGLAMMIFATSTAMVIAGAAAAGFGVSIIFPLAVTAAAGRGGSAAVNVAALSLLSFTGFLIGPPIIGFVTEVFGLRVGMGFLLLPALMSLVLAGEVRVRARRLDDAALGAVGSEAA
ncbi:MFS family permease [Kaistia hirudinis]|uniref:MFS family permease n=1 Tax=Kaistia hirudinis TaxID=1293440 RepID=A0A840AM81_9HYPH|nr:MFS transporter [Kaistia hirudinis]MBB3929556.1 MFS family permease [Kaistia hirudinis]